MQLDNLYAALEKTFATNFVAYYKAHAAHINIRSRSFYADHKLLKKIYEHLQKHIDDLGEEIQSCGVGRVPETLDMILATSSVKDNMPPLDSEGLLHDVLDDLYKLIDVYHEMDQAGKDANYPDVSNMAADHIGKVAKFCWQLEATLDVQGRHGDAGRNT